MPAALLLAATGPLPAADSDDAWQKFRHGDYEETLGAAEKGSKENPYSESWQRLAGEARLVLGRYEDAYKQLNDATRLVPLSFRLRLLAREAARYGGQEDEARRHLLGMGALITSGMHHDRDPDSMAGLGEAALELGAEPRLVLENFFKPARQAAPPGRDAFLAAGRLALAKHDYRVASRSFQDGLKAFPDDPDLWQGLAAAFLNGDRAQLLAHAAKALETNPRHVPTLLLLAEHEIDTEEYAAAADRLAEVLQINPRQPEALALQAVLAALRNDEAAAAAHRLQALATWQHNPNVDHLIGRKLSQKYRFADGATAQRRALELDPEFTPARIQLAEDLLRLGRESEGWVLAAKAHEDDAYDVTAFNLTTLHDRLGGFTTLSSPHFRLRMAAAEAPVYGDRALALLERAHARLTARYGLQLDEPVTVEIYPDPKDFAVRTFGMPGNPGYLGVCFGPVFTVNSPASSSANWESVLWHEFTHVITLTLTRNRMPRWLSEGISVYEEGQARPEWGRLMSLNYRDRILDGKLLPLSRMSAAFLQAKDGEDLQFAYYQSSLVVQYLVARHGFEKLAAVLRALGDGLQLNEALTREVAPIDELDGGFVRFARDEAEKLGGDFDLRRPETGGVRGWVARLHPRNYSLGLQEARDLMEKKDWAAARTRLTGLTAGGLYLPGDDNAYLLLARVCRELGDPAGEQAALTTIAGHEADELPAVTRLLELADRAQDWDAAVRWCEAWLAINPLAPTPWRALLAAHEHRGDRTAAVAAGRVLVRLDPPDAAAVHYRIACQVRPLDTEDARRHLLQALEEAPRFRAAYEMLVSLPER